MSVERIAMLEERADELRERARLSMAELQGVLAELDALRAGSTRPGSLADLERTEAVLSVLRSAGVNLSPTEIRVRLVEAGRSDQLNEVTATLTHLLNRKTVERPSRGKYFVV